ncbi:unnamed protein product [Peronospora destructor]|uniref:Srp40 C-terminal domain-containing protein n=1 Tax=Peronospora destructor TaxID=86335 RepID=A0AAV0TDU9_9STRA|nr:unnamed protein product [Peronospora destructor]
MVVASDLFPLIYTLLMGVGLKKTAAVLTKEAKLQCKAFQSEDDLLDVYQFYLTHNMKKPKREEEDKGQDEESKEKKQIRIKNNAVAKKEESSSSDDSSDSSSDEETKQPIKKTAPVKKKKAKAALKDVMDEVKLKSNKRKAKAPATEKIFKKAKREADSSSDDSSDSSSSDDSSSDSSDSDSDTSDTSDHEEAQMKEAVRREQAAKAALEWQPKQIEKVATKTKSAGTPFQRVDGEFWSQKILDDTLRDNSYEGTFGIDGVGVKANNKLLKTRGKDFTKGKNKLKRSTYMCGAISMASNSFKFKD